MYQFPKLAMRNRQMLELARLVGCYYCCQIYSPSEVTEFTDEGQTCICPKCHVDAVVGDSQGIELSEASLRKAHAYWFSTTKG